MFRQLVYTSQTTIVFNDDDIMDLLEKSRKWNAQNEITGLLLSSFNGNFVQVLEGPSEKIDEVMLRIKRDYRHTSIFKIIDQTVSEREFPNWSMGHHRLEGYSDKDGFLSIENIKSIAEKSDDKENLVLSVVLNLHDSHSGTKLSDILR